MNERIKELAKQAGNIVVEDKWNGDYVEFNKEKFAELIVNECMKLNHDHFNDEDPYSIDSLYRYHFGIE